MRWLLYFIHTKLWHSTERECSVPWKQWASKAAFKWASYSCASVVPDSLFLLALVIRYRDPRQNIRYHFALLNVSQGCVQRCKCVLEPCYCQLAITIEYRDPGQRTTPDTKFGLENIQNSSYTWVWNRGNMPFVIFFWICFHFAVYLLFRIN